MMTENTTRKPATRKPLNLDQAIRLHRHRVQTWSVAYYSIEDAKQDILGIICEYAHRGVILSPRLAMKLLKRRPYGYCQPERLADSPEVALESYADTLAGLAFEGKGKQIVKRSLVNGRLIGRRELATELSVTEWQARKSLAKIEAAMLNALPAIWLAWMSEALSAE